MTDLEDMRERHDLVTETWIQDVKEEDATSELSRLRQRFIRGHPPSRKEWRYVVGPSKADSKDMVGIYYVEW